ncbi:MAG: T9SS type A sorting domain-containing protein [Fidelibacterota bacterium]
MVSASQIPFYNIKVNGKSYRTIGDKLGKVMNGIKAVLGEYGPKLVTASLALVVGGLGMTNNVFAQDLIDYQTGGQAFDLLTNADIDSFQVTIGVLNDTLLYTGFFPTNTWALDFSVLGIDDNNFIPSSFVLGQNYPNPFNPKTNIPISIDEGGNYTLTAYSINGAEGAKISKYLYPGNYNVDFSVLASGLYLLELTGNGKQQVVKAISLDGGNYFGLSDFHGSSNTKLVGPNVQKLSRIPTTFESDETNEILDDELEVYIMAEKEGYQTLIDTLILQPGQNWHDLFMSANNYSPSVELTELITSVDENQTGLPINIANFNVTDPDTGDGYIATVFSSNPDSVFFNIIGNDVFLDSLVQGFNGMANYTVEAQDIQGAVGWATGELDVVPTPDSSLVHFIFKAMYGDTTLTSGTSTLSFRKMGSTGEWYEWAEDSLATSENGVFDVLLEQGVYDINGLHTESLDGALIYTSVYLARPGQIGVIEKRDYEDQQAPILFNTENDTIEVYKLMQDFPLFWAIEWASKLDGVNIGSRGFAYGAYPVNAYWVTGDGHETPDSTRMAMQDSLAAEIRTIPHGQHFVMNQLLVENLDDVENPYFWQGIRSDYPSPGTNATNFNSETHEITIAGAMYPRQPTERTQKIESLQAWFDLEDFGGADPNILHNTGNGYIINDTGRRIISLLLLARRTKL